VKFCCIYCTNAFEADALPPTCPGCSRTFTLTVGPGTTVKALVRALAKNGASPSFNLLRDALPDENAAPAEGVCVGQWWARGKYGRGPERMRVAALDTDRRGRPIARMDVFSTRWAEPTHRIAVPVRCLEEGRYWSRIDGQEVKAP
jgi:hypothetical protein